jgi:hypothetical protein
VLLLVAPLKHSALWKMYDRKYLKLPVIFTAPQQINIALRQFTRDNNKLMRVQRESCAFTASNSGHRPAQQPS